MNAFLERKNKTVCGNPVDMPRKTIIKIILNEFLLLFLIDNPTYFKNIVAVKIATRSK